MHRPSFILEDSGAPGASAAQLYTGDLNTASDLGAGTEQSPASHQSWQDRLAVWRLLLMRGRRVEWGSGDGQTLPKDQKATNCCNGKHQTRTKPGGFPARRKKYFVAKSLFI